MKDQWSGKTLRANSLTATPTPTRWSRKSAALPTASSAWPVPRRWSRGSLAHFTLPVARADGLDEVVLRDQVALVVNGDGQLRQRPLGRAEDRPCLIGDVERRLVAGAQQVVRLLLVQRHRAADVGADLGVGNDAVVRPVLAASGTGFEVLRVEAHQQHDGLGLLLSASALVDSSVALRDDVERRSRW